LEYTDILYDVKDRVATITINRPKVLNAFRARTCDELIHAFQAAGYDREIGAIVLTGAGERAFCTGGDQSDHDGAYAGGRGAVGMAVEEMHTAIRDAAKPVIAKVRGYAIGGGNVLATICDLTLAAESASFGQVGPKKFACLSYVKRSELADLWVRHGDVGQLVVADGSAVEDEQELVVPGAAWADPVQEE